MNPTAGSFTINPRLQRHFATFSVVFPSPDSLFTIYHTVSAKLLIGFTNILPARFWRVT